MTSKNKELADIRKKLRISRVQFGRFVNRCWQSIRRYEDGEEVPVEVLYNARRYEKLFDSIKNGDVDNG